MLCEKCGVNNATTHIRKIVGGVIYEKHLCSSCAASEGYTGANNNDFSKMLSSMFGGVTEPNIKSNTVRCNCCGLSFSDIVKNGKCGCAECYDVFYQQLLPYIKKSQYGRIAHNGKVPKAQMPSPKTKQEEISELKSLLAELVKAEKYEDAAEIRDRIRLLEGEIQ